MIMRGENISLENKPDHCHLAHHKSHKFGLGLSTNIRDEGLKTLTALATSSHLRFGTSEGSQFEKQKQLS
jgi:hypothetical protein